MEKEPVVKKRTNDKDNWLTRSASSIVGIILTFSFIAFVFLSSFDFGWNIELRESVFNTVFMALYGAVTMYFGYIWGASKPQKDTVIGMNKRADDPPDPTIQEP